TTHGVRAPLVDVVDGPGAGPARYAHVGGAPDRPSHGVVVEPPHRRVGRATGHRAVPEDHRAVAGDPPRTGGARAALDRRQGQVPTRRGRADPVLERVHDTVGVVVPDDDALVLADRVPAPVLVDRGHPLRTAVREDRRVV